MKRLAPALLIGFFLATGLCWTGWADVTGMFTFDLSLTPQTNSQESVPFFFDLQSNLQVHITISGMIFGLDLGFGITGLEFTIVSIGTNLGALTIKDEFVFAPPFGCSAPGWLGVVAGLSDDGDGGIAGQCPGSFVSPIGSSDGLVNDGAIGFVKKRVDLQLDIAGISLGVLALFEDVDFPDIHGAKSEALIGLPDGGDHEHDHFLPADLYFVGAHDGVVNNQTPSFGFGTILSVSGQTVSGITVTGTTGLCADDEANNRIKKRKFLGEVNKGCVSETGPLFAFEVERLHIEGVQIGGVRLSTWLEFRPVVPVSGALELGFSLAGLAEVEALFESDNVLTFVIDTITLSLTSSNLSLVLEDLNADLQIDRTTAQLTLTLNPNQNPAGFVSTTVGEMGFGIQSQELELTVTRAGLTIALATLFLQSGSGLAWDSTSFTLSAQLNILTFSADIAFDTGGLQSGTLSVSVSF